jgi:DNA-binding transcriptional ArsR family regulator
MKMSKSDDLEKNLEKVNRLFNKKDQLKTIQGETAAKIAADLDSSCPTIKENIDTLVHLGIIDYQEHKPAHTYYLKKKPEDLNLDERQQQIIDYKGIESERSGLTLKDISEQLDISYSKARVLIKILKAKGKITEKRYGPLILYSSTQKEEDV